MVKPLILTQQITVRSCVPVLKLKIGNRVCHTCGLNPIVNSGKCRKCYNAYMSNYILKRYYRRRADWIDRLGGKCIDCGSKIDLEFDHCNASLKEFDVGKILSTHSSVKIEYEMAKCVLRRKPCHLIKSLHEGDMLNVDHGGGLTGKKNCYCQLCAPLKKAYNIAKGYKKKPKPKREYICGEYRTYKHGCRCALCKKANAEYMRERKNKKNMRP